MKKSLIYRIKRNTAFKVSGEVAVRLAGLGLYVLLARWLGASQFGHFSFAFSYAVLFMVVVDLGTNNIITRDLARKTYDLVYIFPRLNALKLVSAFFAFGLIALSLFFIPTDPVPRSVILIIGFVVIFMSLGEYVGAILSGLEKMGMEAVFKFVQRVFSLMGVTIGFFISKNLLGTVMGLCVGYGASIVVGYFILRFLGAPGGVLWDSVFIKNLLKLSLPLFLSWTFWNFYDNQDILLLKFLKVSSADIGQFAVAMKFIDVFRGVPVLLMGAFYPLFGQFWKTSERVFNHVAVFLIKWIFAISLPLALGGALMAPSLFTVIFGKEYSGSAWYFQVAVWAIVGIFLNHVMTHLLIHQDKVSKTVIGAGIITVVNAVMIVLLVPLWGTVGAAWSLVISELLYVTINLFLLRKFVSQVFATVCFQLIKIIAAAFSMGILLVFMDWNVFVEIFLGAGIYVFLLWVFHGIPLRPLEDLETISESPHGN